MLDCHVHGNLRMRIISCHFKVLKFELLNIFHLPLDRDGGEWPRFSFQLLPQRLDMVRVDMSVAERVNKVARPQPSDMGEHDGEQGVAGDVERHPKAHVCRPLVQLTGQLPVGAIELDLEFKELKQSQRMQSVLKNEAGEGRADNRPGSGKAAMPSCSSQQGSKRKA